MSATVPLVGRHGRGRRAELPNDGRPSLTGDDLGRLVRERFPVLARTVHGHPLTYLDSAATSLKPSAVIEAQADHYRAHDGSAHRGLHALADEATEAYERTRLRVARWLGTGEPESVVYTRSATAALNLVARGMEHRLRPGDEVVLTEMEHHANLVPWIQLAERAGIVLRHVPMTDDGQLDRTAAEQLIGPRTRILSLIHVSNVLGTVNPVAELSDRARRFGATVVVDAAQSVGHLPVSLSELGADLLVLSAHKCYGPAGLGFLVGRPAALDELEPLEGGGQMIRQVFLDRATYDQLPLRLEAGTPNAAAAAALAPALDLLEELGVEAVHAHEQRVTAYAWDRLAHLGGLRLLGPRDPSRRGSLVAFHDPLVHPHDMATILDQRGVAVRAGHHCAQPLHRRLGLVATTRASFAVYTTFADVDRLVDGIREAREVFA
ncbi:MAG: SufS family cysteine desulfurase [Deltaproteobacteria bacterium]|jgi:cysteine desulfurase/selenocysteine lyase|nr:SufS family cysteine desulfurase [Deltaproteobacteria bacterium]MBW2534902.1 SufS family cysteine desulfurase [Deltaproteobacteria bacterium]